MTDTKNIILSASLELFAMKGFSGVSTREIAHKSNANLSAISYHFGSKKGLYKEILLYCFSFVESIIKSAPNNPLKALTHYALKMGELHRQKPFIARFIIINIIEHNTFMSDSIEKCRQKLYTFLKTHFENGINSGIFRKDLDINATIVSFVCVVNFYFALRHFGGLPSEFGSLEQIYSQNSIDIFFNGIKA